MPENDPRLKLNGIVQSRKSSLATINDKTLAVGDTAQFSFPPATIKIKCLEITNDSVLISFEGDPIPRRLRMK